MAAPDVVPMEGVTESRPATIFIATAARMRQGARHLWKYELTLIGESQIHLCVP